MSIPKFAYAIVGIAIILGVFIFIFIQTHQISFSEARNLEEAAKTGDASLCLAFDDIKLKDNCLVRASLVNPDYSVCSMMSDDELKKTDCYLRSANITNNPEACDALDEFYLRKVRKVAQLIDTINEDRVGSVSVKECREAIVS